MEEQFRLNQLSLQTHGFSYLEFQRNKAIVSQLDQAQKLTSLKDDYSRLVKYAEVKPLNETVHLPGGSKPISVVRPIGVRRQIFRDAPLYLTVFDENSNYRKQLSKLEKHYSQILCQFKASKLKFDKSDQYFARLLFYNMLELRDAFSVLGRKISKILQAQNDLDDVRLVARFQSQLDLLAKQIHKLEFDFPNLSVDRKLKQIQNSLHRCPPFDNTWNHELSEDHCFLKQFNFQFLKSKVTNPTPVTISDLTNAPTPVDEK